MRARNGGGKKRRAGKTTVRCSGLLHWDEFASAPWGPSTAAEQSSAQRERERREERGERREAGKTGIRCYCWFQQHGWGKNPEPDSGFRTAPSPSASAEQMESYGENGRETGWEEQEHEAFFSYIAPSRLSHSLSAFPIVGERFYSPNPRSATVKFTTILQPLLCPFLQCRSE